MTNEHLGASCLAIGIVKTRFQRVRSPSKIAEYLDFNCSMFLCCYYSWYFTAQSVNVSAVCFSVS